MNYARNKDELTDIQKTLQSTNRECILSSSIFELVTILLFEIAPRSFPSGPKKFNGPPGHWVKMILHYNSMSGLILGKVLNKRKFSEQQYLS